MILQHLVVFDTLLNIVNHQVRVGVGVLLETCMLLAQVCVNVLIILQLPVEGLDLGVALVLELEIGVHVLFFLLIDFFLQLNKVIRIVTSELLISFVDLCGRLCSLLLLFPDVIDKLDQKVDLIHRERVHVKLNSCLLQVRLH